MLISIARPRLGPLPGAARRETLSRAGARVLVQRPARGARSAGYRPVREPSPLQPTGPSRRPSAAVAISGRVRPFRIIACGPRPLPHPGGARARLVSDGPRHHGAPARSSSPLTAAPNPSSGGPLASSRMRRVVREGRPFWPGHTWRGLSGPTCAGSQRESLHSRCPSLSGFKNCLKTAERFKTSSADSDNPERSPSRSHFKCKVRCKMV
jgi:hypothetical protein